MKNALERSNSRLDNREECKRRDKMDYPVRREREREKKKSNEDRGPLGQHQETNIHILRVLGREERNE